jgi:hypothetical protein
MQIQKGTMPKYEVLNFLHYRFAKHSFEICVIISTFYLVALVYHLLSRGEEFLMLGLMLIPYLVMCLTFAGWRIPHSVFIWVLPIPLWSILLFLVGPVWRNCVIAILYSMMVYRSQEHWGWGFCIDPTKNFLKSHCGNYHHKIKLQMLATELLVFMPLDVITVIGSYVEKLG